MQVSPRIDELRQKFHENPRRYFAPLANEYRKAGDPEQAIAICRAHLAQQPGHMSGHVVYGQALYDAKRTQEAREVFEKALSLDPDNTVVLRQLGDIARENGESAEARHWYTKALDLDPQDTEVAAYVAELTEPIVGDEQTEPAEVQKEAAVQSADSAPSVPEPEAIDILEVEPLEGIAAELEAVRQEAVQAEEVLAVAEDVEEDAEEAVAAATPAEPQGDGAEPQSPDEAQSPQVSEYEAASPDEEVTEETPGESLLDREVALPETNEPEVEPADEAAWRKTPKPEESPFITRTMAELYAKQGYKAAALDVYRQLSIRHPDDSDIRDRIAELTGGSAAAAEPAPAVADESSDTAGGGPETPPKIADARPIEPMGEAYSYTEVPDQSAFPPSSEDLNLTTAESASEGNALHFTESELSDSPSSNFMELEDSPFGELAWEDDATIEEEDLGEVTTAPGETAPADREAEARQVEAEAPAVEEQAPAVEEEEASVVEDQASPVEEAAATVESSDARFVDMPVALGDVQTSIDEAGVAATSPHDAGFPAAASAERVAEAAVESVAGEDEAAAAMIEPEPEPAESEDEEDHAVVAYSPEPPNGEDLPHFTPKPPTIREFFATLGSRRPPSRSAGPSITAHAAAAGSATESGEGEGLPLASDAFSNLFADSSVSEEDTRAAFAISGAMSATAHNPSPESVRTSPPRPAPAVPEAPESTKESEEDIRRFREWLDGLADS